jgi:hypothetical protein
LVAHHFLRSLTLVESFWIIALATPLFQYCWQLTYFHCTLCVARCTLRVAPACLPLLLPRTLTCAICRSGAQSGCQECVRQLAEQRLSTPQTMDLQFHKAHPELKDPTVRLEHHDFYDRPPWVTGQVPMHAKASINLQLLCDCSDSCCNDLSVLFDELHLSNSSVPYCVLTLGGCMCHNR